MTAPTVEQIAEVLAAHGWPMRGTRCRCGVDLGIERPETLDRHQAEQVAALGVGDGEVEWGVRWSENATEPYPSEDDADRAIEDADAGTLVQRTVGLWVEVTDEGGEG